MKGTEPMITCEQETEMKVKVNEAVSTVIATLVGVSVYHYTSVYGLFIWIGAWLSLVHLLKSEIIKSGKG